MKPVTALIIALGILYLKSDSANATCSVEIRDPRPILVSHFGSKNLILEYPSLLSRELNSKLDLYCANGFRGDYLGEYSDSHLQLKCSYNRFMNIFNNNNVQGYLNCADSQTVEMYESNTALPDCENLMTLVVGFKFQSLGSLKNVAICYDIAKQQMKYIGYTAYPSNVIEKTQDGQLNRLGLDIRITETTSTFKQISTIDISTALKKDKQLSQLFGDETFEYKNLIQDEAFNSDLSVFENMIGIVWLRALRIGNWRQLLNALKTARQNGKYDVRVGVSGIVNLPILQHCNETRTLTLELENSNIVSVPAYIWAHIRALQPSINATDEFVVVAHNSPFITNSERHGICSSICQEIDWLKDTLFSKLQNYPVYGLVQCCRLSDVADKLDNFPKSVDVDVVEDFNLPTETTELENDEQFKPKFQEV